MKKLYQWLALLLLSALLLSFAGCDVAESMLDEYWNPDEEIDGDWDEQEDTHDYPVLEDAEELRDFLYESIEDGDYSPRFCYEGDEDDLTARNIARIVSAYFVTVRNVSGSEDCWQVKYTPYPGERIVNAYRNEDTSDLSDDELEALNIALEVVGEAKSNSDNALEIELYLHDWLCDKITYYNGSTNVKNERDILRHLTALGALIDGQANCQGYTDGFYVLASIAGFDVGRQSCVTKDGGHSFNTIRIDGKWYIVDVTFNDDTYRNGTELYQDYRMFNAGIEECAEYTWPDEYAYYPLQKESGPLYYYNLTEEIASEHGYEKCFDDIDDVTDGIVDIRRHSQRNEIHMMLRGEQASWDDLELADALHRYDLDYPTAIWSIVSGENTYFYIRFE